MSIPFGPNLAHVASQELLNQLAPDPGQILDNEPITLEFIQRKRNRVQIAERLVATDAEIELGYLLIHKAEYIYLGYHDQDFARPGWFQAYVLECNQKFEALENKIKDLERRIQAMEEFQKFI